MNGVHQRSSLLRKGPYRRFEYSRASLQQKRAPFDSGLHRTQPNTDALYEGASCPRSHFTRTSIRIGQRELLVWLFTQANFSFFELRDILL